jgi:hypothetical protein
MGCLNCGKDLVQTPGKREKQFCGSKCRISYWQKEKAIEKLANKIPEEKATNARILPDQKEYDEVLEYLKDTGATFKDLIFTHKTWVIGVPGVVKGQPKQAEPKSNTYDPEKNWRYKAKLGRKD